MSTKVIYMDGIMDGDNESESGYIYPMSDDDQTGIDLQYSDKEDQEKDQKKDQEKDQNEYPNFYENLKVISESKIDNNQNQNQANNKINKTRSMSFDSEGSDILKRPNFKCGSCKKTFILDKNQKMIRCAFCGYRILFKLRTRDYITYKTE